MSSHLSPVCSGTYCTFPVSEVQIRICYSSLGNFCWQQLSWPFNPVSFFHYSTQIMGCRKNYLWSMGCEMPTWIFAITNYYSSDAGTDWKKISNNSLFTLEGQSGHEWFVPEDRICSLTGQSLQLVLPSPRGRGRCPAAPERGRSPWGARWCSHNPPATAPAASAARPGCGWGVPLSCSSVCSASGKQGFDSSFLCCKDLERKGTQNEINQALYSSRNC